jgi:hypothetical protein
MSLHLQNILLYLFGICINGVMWIVDELQNSNIGNFIMHVYIHVLYFFEQSYKGKVKTHNYINRQNQSTTGKLWKPQWPWLGTGMIIV